MAMVISCGMTFVYSQHFNPSLFMKRLAILLTLLSSVFDVSGQDTRIREAGFTTANLNDFGLTYRFGSQESVWRVSAVSSGFNNGKRTNDGGTTEFSNISIGTQFGKEWRKVLNEKFELRYGADLQFNSGKSKNESLNIISGEITEFISTTFRTGANAVLGFNFILAENFVLGTEFQPSLTYGQAKLEVNDPTATEPNVSTTESLSFGFSTDNIRLSFLYRF